jgi:protein-disulfide isomerase
MSDGSPDPAVTVRIRRVHLWGLAGILLGVAIGFAIGHATNQKPRPILYGIPPSQPASGASGPASAAPKPRVDVATAGSPAWGPIGAKVTVVEFVDYQCPFCGQYARTTYPQIRKAYAGKVRYVSRHFPLGIHPFASGAAVAAECAQRLGHFWRYHDLLFHTQDALGASSLVRDAKKVGIDPVAFRACTRSSSARSRVQRDLADGRRYGVTGTPTTFINGTPYVGALPFADFKAAIDAALKK